ncbi:SMP-30/gluconolactonase/LRE family protein [Mesorhizobium sp. CN2-181]|uniref:SMP-30/gluconolactonase/LRE family protein n=1 Tax=Mesorhizobium yinganensis TaxID=3157707 RepID=UPI0032B80735
MTEVRCLFDGHMMLAESPVWCPISNCLWWVNLVEPAGVFRLAWSQSAPDFWEAPEPVTGLALTADDNVLVAGRSGLLRLNPRIGRYDMLIALRGLDRPGNRCNEVGVDPKGRFWFSTMDDNLVHPEILPDAGALFCMEPDGSIRRAEQSFGIPNTLLWSNANDRMFFGDTLRSTIYAYPFDAETGSLGERSIHRGPGDPGFPDGSAIDVNDTLWNARWDGGVLLGIDRRGDVVDTVAIPGGNVASACFAGEQFDILVVTTACWGLDDQRRAAPLAGGIFAIEGLGKGRAQLHYAGAIGSWNLKSE